MPLQASTPAIHTQGSLRGGVPPPQRGVWGSERCALVGFPDGLAHQDNPQIRVLPPQEKLATHKFLSVADLPLSSLVQ
jgi:hypothetical protein